MKKGFSIMAVAMLTILNVGVATAQDAAETAV